MPEPRTCAKCGGALPDGATDGQCPNCIAHAGPDGSWQVDPAEEATRKQPGQSAGGFVPPTPEELAARFPQFEILELLGQGGMGAVYKARQPVLDRLVAIKILPPEVETDTTFAQRFTREARALAKLNHPNIVAIHDIGRTGGLFYFVMEYVDGVNLRQAIEAGKMMPRDALAIVPQICDALQFAHDEGIVHRDIKPANILIDKRGRVKIADFGLAKLLGHEHAEQGLTATNQVMGTLRYMAPEQMSMSREVDCRADIYSLGVVFYEMLTGELPIGRFAPPSQKVAIDVRLDEVVLRSLEQEPERRYQHASDLKSEVEAIKSGPVHVPVAMPTPGTPAANDVDSARRQLRWPAIGLIVSGIMDLVFAATVVANMLHPQGHMHPSMIVFCLWFGGPVGLLTIIGGVKMWRLEWPRFVGVTTMAAMIPLAPGFLIGLPCGIWALIVMSRRDVRAAFDRGGDMPPAAVAPATPIPIETDLDRARRQVRWPAIGLIVSGIIDLGFAAFILASVGDGQSSLNLRGLVVLLYGGPVGLLTILGAVKLWRLESPRFVAVTAVAAMIPFAPGCLIGLPCAIWALIVTGRRDVRAAFDSDGDKPLATPASATPEAIENDLARARWLVRGPAKGLIASGIFNLACVPIFLTCAVLRIRILGSLYDGNHRLIAIELAGFSAAIGLLTIMGGVKMRRLEKRRLAMLASVWAVVPCTPGALIGIPSGIWALVVLNLRTVRAAFDSATCHVASEASSPATDENESSANRELYAVLLWNLVLIALIAFAMWISNSAWALAFLFLTAASGTIMKENERGRDFSRGISFLACLPLIAYGIWLAGSGWPILAVFAWGLGELAVNHTRESEARKPDEASKE